jgi:hypothetical protein
MVFSLREAASRYLHGEPLPWLTFFHLYSKALFGRLSGAVNAGAEEVSLSTFADEMYTLFLRPDFARDVSLAGSEEQGSAMVNTRCGTLLAHSNLIAVSRYDDESDLSYIYGPQKVVIVDQNEEYAGIDSEFAVPLRSIKLPEMVPAITSAEVKDSAASASRHNLLTCRAI